jgi:hypothetical protein
MGDGVQLALHVPPQVGALGQLLVQQPKGADGRTIASPLEEVAFPVAGYRWTVSRRSEI